jgi:tetratricopeptide (TPR) repeat protein
MHSQWTVHHTGFPQFDRAATDKRKERNEKLLLKELEDDPTSALDMQYMAHHRQNEERWGEALDWFKKCIVHADKQKDLTWLPEVYINMARCYTRLGMRGKAKKTMERGIKECGHRAFAYFADRQLAVKSGNRTVLDVVKERRESLRVLSR